EVARRHPSLRPHAQGAHLRGRRASLTRTSARALASTHRARAPDQGSSSLAWARVLSLDRTFFTPTIAITITHPTRRGGESLGFIRVCAGSQLVSKSDPVSTSYRSDRYQGRYRKPPEGGWLHARD